MNYKKILVIIQRSNGDVFFSSSLIEILYNYFDFPQIDLLVNDDTRHLANLIPFVNNIYLFSYLKKKNNRWNQEIKIIKKIYRKYDLSINLTASDRSVIYSLLASRKSISSIEKKQSKSWWKKLLLSHYYYFDSSRHILMNNFQSLKYLNIPHKIVQKPINSDSNVLQRIRDKLQDKGINNFFIFHPSAQYQYKIYPRNLRHELLTQLSILDVAIIVTGSKNQIDTKIKNELSILPNVYDLIGETTLEEYIALSELSLAYIGMDTLNMHIAAAQDKPVFAIFGPTNLSMWSPWSNKLQKSASSNKPRQRYGNITIFQANMPCVACGNAGCDDQHGKSECLDHISPKMVFDEIKNWHQNAGFL
jgi:heptosyltransferase III